MNKRGSLSLSIELIVIVVIAFVVLGLGLGFVRGLFGGLTEDVGTIQEQVRQQILDDLRTGNKKLSFPATSMIIERGESRDIAFGVKDVKTGDLQYSITLDVTDMQEKTVPEAELDDQINFFYDKSITSLGPIETRVHAVRVSALGTQGTYLVKLSIFDEDVPEDAPAGDNVYDEKTFFITIS